MHNLYTWADVPDTLRYLPVSGHVLLGLFVVIPCFILKSHASFVHSCFTSFSLCCFPAVFCVTCVSSANESSVYTQSYVSSFQLPNCLCTNSPAAPVCSCVLLVYDLFIYCLLTAPCLCCLLHWLTSCVWPSAFKRRLWFLNPYLVSSVISVFQSIPIWRKGNTPSSNTSDSRCVMQRRDLHVAKITRSVQTEPPASGLPLPRMWRTTLTAESECSAFNTDHHTLCWAWQINRLPAQQAPGKEINITAVSLLNLLKATNSETWVWQETHFQLSHVSV